jgi:4-hydroxy-3-polyprenylbenzoate decarboxylase
MHQKNIKNITLGITGASGIPIAFTLLKQLLLRECVVHLIITTAGMVTIKEESDIALSASPKGIKDILTLKLDLLSLGESAMNNLHVYTNSDWYAPIASGSSVDDAMVVCPCSMASLAKIANGISDDLLARAADVILKERKNLILVPRETPFSAIQLENMLKLAKLGVAIIPPVPAFYTHPKILQDVIDFIVSRILDQLGVSNDLIKRW